MTEKIHAQVEIDVTVHDIAQLRAYALKRAGVGGLSESEFEELRIDHPHGDISYFIGWAFDNGTPDNCGFQIERSSAEIF